MVSATAGTTGAPVVEETTYATTTTTTTTNEYGINRLAAKYLKTAAEQYEGLDDLEIDYANEFLKKGLVLGADFEGGDRWDERFMTTLKRFYASLMQQAHPFIPDIAAKWRAYSGEKVHRSRACTPNTRASTAETCQWNLKWRESSTTDIVTASLNFSTVVQGKLLRTRLTAILMSLRGAGEILVAR